MIFKGGFLFKKENHSEQLPNFSEPNDRRIIVTSTGDRKEGE